jgi:hypothetical protein
LPEQFTSKAPVFITALLISHTFLKPQNMTTPVSTTAAATHEIWHRFSSQPLYPLTSSILNKFISRIIRTYTKLSHPRTGQASSVALCFVRVDKYYIVVIWTQAAFVNIQHPFSTKRSVVNVRLDIKPTA